MKNSNEYLDEVKKKLKISSDYKLAKHLNVAKSTISRYRSGRPLDVEIAWSIAEELGIKPTEIIISSEIERAERSEDSEKVAVWKKRFHKISDSAASIFIFATLLAGGKQLLQVCILCQIEGMKQRMQNSRFWTFGRCQNAIQSGSVWAN